MVSADDENDDVETKQTYVSQYENLQISAISQPGEKFSDGGEHSGRSKERQLLSGSERDSIRWLITLRAILLIMRIRHNMAI